jgi:hypothetical protein
MKVLKRKKLNQMLNEWPTSGLHTTASLDERGVSKSLRHHYVKYRWLEKVARGLYRRPGDVTEWSKVVHTFQNEKTNTLHLGGLSALEVHGYGHYIHMEERPLFLYGSLLSKRFPAWFKSAINRKMFYISMKFLENVPERCIVNLLVEGSPLLVSTPELAVLEMLYTVPTKVGFDEAFKIVESLVVMRTDLLQILLENCKNVKVKRLFLYFAREIKHGWYSKLNRGKINIGSGKRELIKGGKLDKEFLLTVNSNYFSKEVLF